MSDSDSFKLKWKGRQIGPFSEAQIRSLLKERKVSLMHEVFEAGEWVTLRKFLHKRDAPPPAAAGPGSGGVTAPGSASLAGGLPKPDVRESKAPVSSIADLSARDYRLTEAQHQRQLAAPQGAFHLAGFWMRFGALAFDALLVLAVLYGVHLLGAFDLPALPHSRAEFFELVAALFSEHYLFIVLMVLVLWLYCAAFESSHLQATPGKRFTGLRVVRDGGGQLTFADASVRFAGKLASAILACWGFFLAAFTEHKQALHDVIAKCYVVGAVSDRRAFH